MKNIFVFVLLVSSVMTRAQSARVLNAYASSGDIATDVYGHKYDPAKKYLVVRLWNQKEPISKEEETAFDKLKTQLAKKNVEVVVSEWKSAEDIVALLKKHGIETKADTDNGLRLTSKNYNFNTSNNSALFLFEDGKPTSICSGENCLNYLKAYFGLVATN